MPFTGWLGAIFLLAFTGGFVNLWDLRQGMLTEAAARRSSQRLIVWVWTMTAMVWLTVLVGTYIVYPWYRAKPPAGVGGLALAAYPKSLLLSDPRTADWHEFGMEWKEHLAWFAPILVTAVAFVVTRYRDQLGVDSRVRNTLLLLYNLAFFAATGAGLLGALINKAAPTR